LTTMDPHVIRAIKQVALDLDRTASDIMEEAAKDMLRINLVTFLMVCFSVRWCSSIHRESHEEKC
jgi:hypothetical protein